MFRRLRDVPECLGNIDGVDYPADILVRVNTKIKDIPENISINKDYHVTKITSYGDPFDVTIKDDTGKQVQLGEWFFEDVI